MDEEHRVWLARQLCDKQMSDAEAYGIVAFSPMIEPLVLSAAAERERELLKSGEYWLDRHCDDTAALHAAAERERELVEALNGLVDAIDYRETPEGRRSYAILGTMPVALHRARALQAKEPS
jgi:predicted deacylase